MSENPFSVRVDVPVSMVERVVLILDVFARSSGRLTLGQITTRSRLPRSSVHRILQQLVDARWVQRHDNEYSLGLRMFEIGSQVVARTRLTEAAKPSLHDLSRITGQTVHLAVLDRHDVVYLEKICGDSGNTLPSRIGGRLPAHRTGVGKVLLAHARHQVTEDYLAHGLSRQTRAGTHDPARLQASLATIRDLGYATEIGEAAPGIGCVAAAIFEHDDAVAAVSICGPQQLVQTTEMKLQVIRAAADISRRIVSRAMAPRFRPAALAGAARSAR
ncbi:IclR family transcriptional regulator [Gordonia sp. ABSL1-1]|uniref:IclR family transcriptional regulator n=1 Tax=Gordonia sp. ABSL1-1 TaxID=3053923 RepID=UPI00257292C0|nr:IclR family transcriptional regulator [Gordonia sp. ABSL1-1]MDL9938098.1 IclR family transcriptional regulator [Gordonia sp. ABSL1-1]